VTSFPLASNPLSKAIGDLSMMPRNRTAIALVAIASLSQCGSGFGEGSQTQRAVAAPSSGVLTQRQAVAIRHLKWPQSSEAMTKRFGPPAAISRSQDSTRYRQHYADRSSPVAVEFRVDGVAVGISEGQ
jgi:CRISPR/Cas system-associated exonuclease Cas4 (RecB family)